MKEIVYLLLALFAIACANKPEGKVTVADTAKVNDETVAETDDDYVPQRSEYSFRTEVRTIEEDGEVRWANWSKGSIGEILEDDWNFDGIPDLQVCTGPMNGFGNFTYDVWLWNDKVHQFEPMNNDCEIYSPKIDAGNKCIVSIWRLDDDVEIVRYKWKDGKLVETEREQMSYSDLTED